MVYGDRHGMSMGEVLFNFDQMIRGESRAFQMRPLLDWYLEASRVLVDESGGASQRLYMEVIVKDLIKVQEVGYKLLEDAYRIIDFKDLVKFTPLAKYNMEKSYLANIISYFRFQIFTAIIFMILSLKEVYFSMQAHETKMRGIKVIANQRDIFDNYISSAEGRLRPGAHEPTSAMAQNIASVDIPLENRAVKGCKFCSGCFEDDASISSIQCEITPKRKTR